MSALADAWTTNALAKVTSLIKDGSHGSHQDNAEGVPLLSAKDVRDGALLIPSDCRRISEGDYALIHRRYSIAKNDILLTIVGSIGRCYQITGQEPRFTIQRSVAVVRPSAITSSYLCHYFRSEAFQQNLKDLTNASAQGGVYLGALANCFVKYPLSEDEQGQIAEILSTVDRAIEQTEGLIAKGQRIKIGLMQDLLSCGVDEHGCVRRQKTHEFKDSPRGRIPREWWVASIGELFEKRTERGKLGLPVMSIVMNDGLVDRASVERRVESNLPAGGHALALRGDIAYNMMRMWQGVLGRASFDCLVSPAYIVLKPNDKIDTRFAEWLFRDERSVLEFRRSSRGVVDDRLRLYPDDLFSIKFAIPESLDEQQAIAERLDAVKAQIGMETAILEQYQRLRVGLMQDLLGGKERVTSLLGPNPARATACCLEGAESKHRTHSWPAQSKLRRR
jgi:type I restriction enzyme, S subunit